MFSESARILKSYLAQRIIVLTRKKNLDLKRKQDILNSTMLVTGKSQINPISSDQLKS